MDGQTPGLRGKVAIAAIVASLVFCLYAGAAFASTPEWRQGGGSLSEAIATKWHGTVTFTDEGAEGAGHPLKLVCEETGEGHAGPGAVDEETKSSWPSCTVTGTLCERGSLVLEHKGLPWHSEVVVSEEKLRDVIGGGGKGTPGVEIECTVGGVQKVVDECTGTLKTTATDVAGGVETTFDSEPLKCTHPGHANSNGTIEGTHVIEAAKGPALEVVQPTNWMQGGKALTESVVTKSSGVLKLTDADALGGKLSVECKDTGEGSAGTGGSDEQTKLSLSSCTLVASSSCETSPQMKPLHLPWHSELVSSEGLSSNNHDITVSSGKGNPGFAIECRVGGIQMVVDECTGKALRAAMTNVVAGASGSFDGEALTCTDGGAGAGILEGTQLVEATKGSALEVKVQEWRQAGLVLAEPVGVKSKGTVILTDERATGGAISLSCEDTLEGSVGLGALDEITKSTMSSCVAVGGKSGSCETKDPVALAAKDLPWRSELLPTEGVLHDLIVADGKGNPGFAMECTVGGIHKTVDECTATQLKTSVTNAAGGVDETYDGEKPNCSIGGSGAGALEGTQLVEATKGGKLEALS
jgi:hypothetical protein